MCFSPQFSFGAGIILTSIGIICLKSASYSAEASKDKKEKKQWPFAAMPLIFALQQFSEGILWLALNGTINPLWQKLATNIFLFFALILWPVYTPFSIYFLEPNYYRKKLLIGTFLAGLTLAAFSIYSLINYETVANVISNHIHYDVNISYTIFFETLYLISTILPFFISSIKNMWVLGITILIALLVTYIFYTQFLISVWCFFAAVLSFMVYWVIKKDF